MALLTQRIKQLSWAIKANFITIEKQLIEEELTSNERKLFFAMSKVDQYHALRVYQTVKELWFREQLESNSTDKEEFDRYEYTVLKKTALLHDIGRVKGDFNIIHKVIAVIFDKIIEGKDEQERQSIIARIVSKRQPRFLYIYYHHPILSKNKLEQIESDPLVIYLTEHHHEEVLTKKNNSKSKLLDLVKRADALN